MKTATSLHNNTTSSKAGLMVESRVFVTISFTAVRLGRSNVRAGYQSQTLHRPTGSTHTFLPVKCGPFVCGYFEMWDILSETRT